MNKACRIHIGGRVQGVGFRYWTRRLAGGLALAGWVRNEPDGTVTVACEGPADRVAVFISRLREGPPGARVDSFETRDIQTGTLDGDFRITFR